MYVNTLLCQRDSATNQVGVNFCNLAAAGRTAGVRVGLRQPSCFQNAVDFTVSRHAL
jgi:hypothetical protein